MSDNPARLAPLTQLLRVVRRDDDATDSAFYRLRGGGAGASLPQRSGGGAKGAAGLGDAAYAARVF